MFIYGNHMKENSLFITLRRPFILLLMISLAIIPVNNYAQDLPGAHTMPQLPLPGHMIEPSPPFVPILLKRMTVYPQEPFRFRFSVDSGDSLKSDPEIQEESERLIKYFLTSLTVPKDDLWVNLSPYEENRIIPDALGQTELGMDLLTQDYILKQLAASLIYPEKELGQRFWDRVRQRAYDLYGTTEIPADTYHKVWILPDQAEIYTADNTVEIVKSSLKVMLEEDYFAIQNASAQPASRPIENIAQDVMREVILPEIEREVNEGEHFAPLRQIYHSLILAQWYKETVGEGLLGRMYIDRNKIAGVELDDKMMKEKIYARYNEAFKAGVFNFVKEDHDLNTNEVIPRKYFSGGVPLKEIFLTRSHSRNPDSRGKLYEMEARFEPPGRASSSVVPEIVLAEPYEMNKMGIIFTVGPRTEDEEKIKSLIKKGGRMVRFNMSHTLTGKRDDVARSVHFARNAGLGSKRTIGIFADLQGAKIRIVHLEKDIDLKVGDYLTIVPEGTEPRQTTGYKIEIEHDDFLDKVDEGQVILFDDGKIEAVVESVDIKNGSLKTRVTKANVFQNRKGVHFAKNQAIIQSMEALTQKDIDDVKWLLSKDVQMKRFALSFVRSERDVMALLDLFVEQGAVMPKFDLSHFKGDEEERIMAYYEHLAELAPPIISKFETAQAVEEATARKIMRLSKGGIMVARGDLALDIDSAEIPSLEENLVEWAHESNIPAILATQVYSGYGRGGRGASRSDKSGVDKAVDQKYDYVMLSEETSGKDAIYAEEAVEELYENIRVSEKNKKRKWLKENFPADKPVPEIAETISRSAVKAAKEAGVYSHVIITETGKTALDVTDANPATRVVPMTTNRDTVAKLSIRGNNNIVRLEFVPDVFDETINFAAKFAIQRYRKEIRERREAGGKFSVIFEHGKNEYKTHSIRLMDLASMDIEQTVFEEGIEPKIISQMPQVGISSKMIVRLSPEINKLDDQTRKTYIKNLVKNDVITFVLTIPANIESLGESFKETGSLIRTIREIAAEGTIYDPARPVNIMLEFSSTDRGIQGQLIFAKGLDIDTLLLPARYSADEFMNIRQTLEGRFRRYIPIVADISDHRDIANMEFLWDLIDGININRGSRLADTNGVNALEQQAKLIKSAIKSKKAVIVSHQKEGHETAVGPDGLPLYFDDIFERINGIDAIMMDTKGMDAGLALKSIVLLKNDLKKAETFANSPRKPKNMTLFEVVAKAAFSAIHERPDIHALINVDDSGKSSINDWKEDSKVPIIAIGDNIKLARRLIGYGIKPVIVKKGSMPKTYAEHVNFIAKVSARYFGQVLEDAKQQGQEFWVGIKFGPPEAPTFTFRDLTKENVYQPEAASPVVMKNDGGEKNGGIDMKVININENNKGQAADFSFPSEGIETLIDRDIDGLVPVILQFQPVPPAQPLWGRSSPAPSDLDQISLSD